MKNFAGIIILYIVVILTIIGCFPDGEFHSLIDITLDNQSSYNVDFFTRRVGEYEEISYIEHGRVFSGTSESFQRSSGYTYSMYCTDQDEIYTWGPQEVYIDFDQPFTWIIENPPPTPTGDITVNNNSNYNVTISIGGLIAGIIYSGDNDTYTKPIGNYNLIAQINGDDLNGYAWQENIDLTEDGYIWNLNANTELYPSDNCRVWDFENNYADHLGVDDWNQRTNNLIFSSNIKKFNMYSLSANTGENGYIYRSFSSNAGESQSRSFWGYINISNGEILDQHDTCLYKNFDDLYPDSRYIEIAVRKLAYSNDFKIILELKKNDTFDPVIIEDTQIITNLSWHYIGYCYNQTNDIIYLIVDNRIIESSILGDTWDSYPFSTRLYIYNNYNNLGLITFYVDEFIIMPDQFIDPQFFVDHYNHNVPWGGEYIP